MTAAPLIDPQGLTAVLMTDLVVANVTGLLQEARNECPTVAHSDWCYREAFRTLSRYSAVASEGDVTRVLGDIAMLFDKDTVARVLADDADAADAA